MYKQSADPFVFLRRLLCLGFFHWAAVVPVAQQFLIFIIKFGSAIHFYAFRVGVKQVYNFDGDDDPIPTTMLEIGQTTWNPLFQLRCEISLLCFLSANSILDFNFREHPTCSFLFWNKTKLAPLLFNYYVLHRIRDNIVRLMLVNFVGECVIDMNILNGILVDAPPKCKPRFTLSDEVILNLSFSFLGCFFRRDPSISSITAPSECHSHVIGGVFRAKKNTS